MKIKITYYFISIRLTKILSLRSLELYVLLEEVLIQSIRMKIHSDAAILFPRKTCMWPKKTFIIMFNASFYFIIAKSYKLHAINGLNFNCEMEYYKI